MKFYIYSKIYGVVEVLISRDDANLLVGPKWHADLSHSYKGKNYLIVKRNIPIGGGRYKKQKLHRAVMGNKNNIAIAPNVMVDHINGNTLDNRRSNLRVVDNRNNQLNRVEHRNGKLPGVTWHKARGKWQAQIKVNGKRHYLGLFTTEIEASERYLKAARDFGVEVC